jgi:site-specific recombinase XerC
VWRHTCATHLVQNHANLRHVQDLLGHGSLSTTEKYLRLTIEDLKEAHAKYHPREKDAQMSEMHKPKAVPLSVVTAKEGCTR